MTARTLASYVQKTEDPRDYRVDFSKIHSTFGFEITKRVPDGIRTFRPASAGSDQRSGCSTIQECLTVPTVSFRSAFRYPGKRVGVRQECLEPVGFSPPASLLTVRTGNSQFTGAKYAVACATGTAALTSRFESQGSRR